MTSYSTLTILLILIAALSTPAAAVNRKLQRRKGRKLSSSGEGKNSKCHKAAKYSKDSCIRVVMDDFVGEGRNNFIEIGKKVVNFKDGSYTLKDSAVGTTWISNGKIKDPNENFKNEDYFYHITCDVLKGSIEPKYIYVKRAICHLDICIGSTDDDGEKIPDCVYLKGFIKETGKNPDKPVLLSPTSFNDITEGQPLRNVADFYASIVSGTGRFVGSIGQARVFPKGDFDSPNGDKQWEIDIDASVYPWFNSKLVATEPSPMFGTPPP